ncbi:MAG: site-2 protease family protein [Ruminococcus sp.]|nr:site-2 protease family protein [Ruminococcus sp.]
MGIIIALLIFGLIVTVHEFGHFICAKASNIKVLEFSIGMGPKLLQRRKGETAYSLRALPVGGYCAMAGEDEITDDERGFRSAKLWKRMIVLVAGAAMNFVLGFVLLIAMVCMMTDVPTTVVSGFAGYKDDAGQVHYTARSLETGLMDGDRIISMDGTRIFSVLDLNYMFATTTVSTHDLVVRRDGKRVELPDVEFYNENTGGTQDFGLDYKSKTPLTVTRSAGEFFMSMGHIVGMSLKQMVTGKLSKDDVSGPVGVVSAISETAKESESALDAVFNLIYMAALITINVGIFNLLPIPGLDGGRLLFCFIELIRRKPVKPEHEGYVHLAGMALLFGIMIFATYNDIARLITEHFAHNK